MRKTLWFLTEFYLWRAGENKEEDEHIQRREREMGGQTERKIWRENSKEPRRQRIKSIP